MDEIDNDALPLLLFLDDELFPQLLEWSASKGWSDLVIFLLETDYLRFKTNDIFESDYDSLTLYEPFHLIEKNSEGCFDKFFTPEKVEAMKRLLNSGIPLKSVYSQVCAEVWKEMLRRGNQIIHSTFWPSVRRCIVQHHEIDIECMLEDVAKRKYFDRYIQNDPSDLASLQCLLSVRRILKAVSRYKVGPDSPDKPATFASNMTAAANNLNNPGSTGLDVLGFFLGRSKDDSGPSIMNRWRASKNAVVSASKALQAPFAGHHAATTPGGNASPQHPHDYSDPFEAFKILLEGTRQLQKQFFPTSANLTSSGNSAFATQTTVSSTTNGFLYGGSNRRGSIGNQSTSSDAGDSGSAASSPRGRSNSGGSPRQQSTSYANTYSNTYSNNSSNTNSNPQSAHHHHHHGSHGSHALRNCSGISEALRIEIQSTLTINASVRAREIETVDRAFAFACAHMLEKLLLALEQEMLTYISAIFTEFEETNDYAFMVAHARALQCKRVSDYVSKLEFLYDRVRQQRIVSWKDAHTRGKVFIAYEQLNVEGDDRSIDGAAVRGDRKGSTQQVGPKDGNNNGSAPSSPDKNGLSKVQSNVTGPSQTSASGTYRTGAEDDSKESVPFKPNVVAISLEIVLPHTTILSPTTVATCPFRVSLYAGGRRRAARLKPKPVLPGSVVTAALAEASRVASFATLLKSNQQQAASFNSSTTPSPTDSSVSAPHSPIGVPSSPTKSPMRRLSSVKFQFSEPLPVVVPEAQGSEDESKEMDTKVARSHSIDSEHEHADEDTLSELPIVGIAGSITRRSITNAGDIGTGSGNVCFNDIVNANNNSGVFSSTSGKQLIDGFVEDEAEESSDSRSGGSDSSSDYDGDVRQVYSNADLDQLMLRTSSDAPDMDEPVTPRGGKYNRSRRGSSAKLMSRTASNASVATTATGASALTAGMSVGSGAYDDGMRKLVAIDTAKLDRTLYRNVLGSAQALIRQEGADKQGGSSGGTSSAAKSNNSSTAAKRITTKQLVASLAVALASALCGEEQFGKKFAAPVEESFTFTTDARGLELLNDLLYSKTASWLGRDQAEPYVQAFEKVTSVFRQNSMLDTSRPVYRVCVQVQSTVLKAAEAAKLKQQMTTAVQADSARVSSSGSGRSSDGPPKAPLHPGHHHHHGTHGVAGRIAHSHIRIGVSYTQLTPTHTMLNTLHTIATAACSALSGAQDASDFVDSRELSDDRTEESKGEASMKLTVAPLPLKLRYQDFFSEYSSTLRTPAPTAINGLNLQETLYELYLGTDPSLGASPKQNQRKGIIGKSLCEPITRHVGLCDFAMSEVVVALSPRLVLQILMLVLVDRPVMLLSTSSTLLSKVQAMIPRLIWPFRVEKTHVVRQILNGSELHRFVYRHDVPFVSETQQPVIREKKLNRKTSSWREMITRFATNVSTSLSSSKGGQPENPNSSAGNLLSRSPRPSVPRQRKSGSSSDLLAGILRRTASGAALGGSPTPVGTGSEDGDVKSGSNSPVNLTIDIPSRSGGDSPQRAERSPFTRIVTPPSLQLPMQNSSKVGADFSGGDGEEADVQVDHHSCILGVDANAFYTAAPELREELENLRIRGSAFTIIDIDSGVILNRRPDDFDEEEGEAPPKPLPSRLSDPEVFRCANFGIFRSLLKSATLVNEDLQAFTKVQFKPVLDEFNGEASAPDPQLIASRMAEKIVMSNRELEKAFYAFWSELVLRALPKSIQHYPGPRVISCDVRAMLTELLHTVVASSASMDMGEDAEDLQLAPGSFTDSRQGSTRSIGSRGSGDGEVTNGGFGTSFGGYSAKALSCASRQLPAITPNAQLFDHMNKMPFEEFLAMFVEQVASHGETNMCYAFYKEFIADGSVVFKDLLTRHSAVLDRWSM